MIQNAAERALRDGYVTPVNLLEPEESLSHQMLTFPMRSYIINVKRDIFGLMNIISKKLPEPTRQNCLHPNTLVWFNIWDEFLKNEDNPSREPLFRALRRIYFAALNDKLGWWSHIRFIKTLALRAIRKLFLGEHEHDHSYYGFRMDLFEELWLTEVLNGNYKPRSADYPNICWKGNPNERTKGFRLIQYCYSQKRVGQPLDANKIKEIIESG